MPAVTFVNAKAEEPDPATSILLNVLPVAVAMLPTLKVPVEVLVPNTLKPVKDPPVPKKLVGTAPDQTNILPVLVPALIACVAGEEMVITSRPEPVLVNVCFVESIVATMTPEELEVNPVKVVIDETSADKPAEPLTVNEVKLG